MKHEMDINKIVDETAKLFKYMNPEVAEAMRAVDVSDIAKSEEGRFVLSRLQESGIIHITPLHEMYVLEASIWRPL